MSTGLNETTDAPPPAPQPAGTPGAKPCCAGSGWSRSSSPGWRSPGWAGRPSGRCPRCSPTTRRPSCRPTPSRCGRGRRGQAIRRHRRAAGLRHLRNLRRPQRLPSSWPTGRRSPSRWPAQPVDPAKPRAGHGRRLLHPRARTGSRLPVPLIPSQDGQAALVLVPLSADKVTTVDADGKNPLGDGRRRHPDGCARRRPAAPRCTSPGRPG